MEFTLPSGRVLTLREPTYGDDLDAQDAAFGEPQPHRRLNAYLASLTCAVSGLTAEELRKLPVRDGNALEREVRRLTAERPEADEAPFENAS